VSVDDDKRGDAIEDDETEETVGAAASEGSSSSFIMLLSSTFSFPLDMSESLLSPSPVLSPITSNSSEHSNLLSSSEINNDIMVNCLVSLNKKTLITFFRLKGLMCI